MGALYDADWYFVDVDRFGASGSSGFELSLMFFVGIVAIYATYLGFVTQKEQKP